MPEESINIYMSLVDKVSGPLSGIFRGVRAHLGAPMGRMAHWGEEEERSGADAGRKTGGAERSFFRRRPAMRPIRSVIGGSSRIGGAEIKMSAKKPPRRAAGIRHLHPVQ